MSSTVANEPESLKKGPSEERKRTDLPSMDANDSGTPISKYHSTLRRIRAFTAFLDYSEYVTEGKGLDSAASINSDGRISLHFDLKEGMPHMPPEHAEEVEEFAVDKKGWNVCPKMNIVIMIVGSRGMSTESFHTYLT
jgi:hypothetical protein